MSTLTWLRGRGELEPTSDMSVKELPTWFIDLVKHKRKLDEDSIQYVSSESDESGEASEKEVVKESDESGEASEKEVVEESDVSGESSGVEVLEGSASAKEAVEESDASGESSEVEVVEGSVFENGRFSDEGNNEHGDEQDAQTDGESELQVIESSESDA